MSGIETSTEFRRLGTCLVTWDTRNMGYTKGGVTVKITTTWVDITVDRWGEVPLDAVDIGTIIDHRRLTGPGLHIDVHAQRCKVFHRSWIGGYSGLVWVGLFENCHLHINSTAIKAP